MIKHTKALVWFSLKFISYSGSNTVWRFTSFSRGNPLSLRFWEIFLQTSMYFVTGKYFSWYDYFSCGDSVLILFADFYSAWFHDRLYVSFLAAAILLQYFQYLPERNVELFSKFIDQDCFLRRKPYFHTGILVFCLGHINGSICLTNVVFFIK